MLFRDVSSLLIIFVLTMPQPLRRGTALASESRHAIPSSTKSRTAVIKAERWQKEPFAALICAAGAVVWLQGSQSLDPSDGRPAPPTGALHSRLDTSSVVFSAGCSADHVID